MESAAKIPCSVVLNEKQNIEIEEVEGVSEK